MTAARERLDHIVQQFVSDHLPSFLGLLGDQGVDPEEQRVRADRLVRSLRGAEVQSGLRRNGRRIIVDLDRESDPPAVVFNEDFVDELDDSEALSLLEKPVQVVFGLTPFRVKLLLQIDDPEDRKDLVNRARRNADAEVASLADIPSVVELRLELFVARLEAIVEELANEVDIELELRPAVRAVVSSDTPGWPSWQEVSSRRFAAELLERIERAAGEEHASPAAATLAEICWESLELSPGSSLRRSAELLRAERNDALDLEQALLSFAEILLSDGTPLPEEAAEWPEFREIHDQWNRLFRTEQRILSASPVRRETPSLSVFAPPRETLRLDEPESLPWDVPLLGWSVRERRALCDLLEGTRETASTPGPDSSGIELGIETLSSLPAFESAEQTSNFDLRPAPGNPRDFSPSDERISRAVRSCYGRMFRNFCGLDTSDQREVLQRLRSGYDGFFDWGETVWERRFQAWETFEPPRAFRLLTRELESVLGPEVLFDPFVSATEAEVRSVPRFTFVAAFSAGAPTATVRVPLLGLRASFEGARAVVRAVEVPAEEGPTCTWLGDVPLTMQRLTEMPGRELLETVDRDTVGLQVERS